MREGYSQIVGLGTPWARAPQRKTGIFQRLFTLCPFYLAFQLAFHLPVFGAGCPEGLFGQALALVADLPQALPI